MHSLVLFVCGFGSLKATVTFRIRVAFSLEKKLSVSAARKHHAAGALGLVQDILFCWSDQAPITESGVSGGKWPPGFGHSCLTFPRNLKVTPH